MYFWFGDIETEFVVWQRHNLVILFCYLLGVLLVLVSCCSSIGIAFYTLSVFSHLVSYLFSFAILSYLIWYPILSHLVSYQPRLFIAKCCCQQRWRPPACWRWMWMWHKILMSNSTPLPSTAHQTLLYQPSLRRTFSAPGPGMVLFSVPYGMPGNGSAIIHAHSSSRLII